MRNRVGLHRTVLRAGRLAFVTGWMASAAACLNRDEAPTLEEQCGELAGLAPLQMAANVDLRGLREALDDDATDKGRQGAFWLPECVTLLRLPARPSEPGAAELDEPTPRRWKGPSL